MCLICFVFDVLLIMLLLYVLVVYVGIVLGLSVGVLVLVYGGLGMLGWVVVVCYVVVVVLWCNSVCYEVV